MTSSLPLLLLAGLISSEPPVNPAPHIDDCFQGLWKKHSIEPSPPVDDLTFLRRASLDLIGRIPRAGELRAFLRLPNAARRKEWVHRLIVSEEHASHQSRLWQEWLLPPSAPGEARSRFQQWLSHQFSINVPYHELIEKLITATGSSRRNPAVHFIEAHLGEAFPKAKWKEEGQFDVFPLTGKVMRAFLSSTVDCTRCHHHPFVDTLQTKHFWRLNAIFRQVERREVPSKDPTKKVAVLGDNPEWNKSGKLQLPFRGHFVQVVKAAFIDGTPIQATKKQTRRQIFARLLVKHPHFARTYVNRMWKYYFGRSLLDYEPDPSFGKANETVHGQLLNILTDAFRDSGYDCRSFSEWLCNTRVYALSTRTNKTNRSSKKAIYFSRRQTRRLSREQLILSVLTALDAPEGQRARITKQWHQELPLWTHDYKICELEQPTRAIDPVHRSLWLMNSPSLHRLCGRPGGLIGWALKQKTLSEAIDEIYRSVLGRMPKSEELKRIKSLVAKHPEERRPILEDLLWALLNSREFSTNH